MVTGKKQNSENLVYLKIKTAIRKKYIKQGSQLVEVTLAQQLGVSRTPVRSAIKKLESEGLVKSITNRGAFVITPTKKEIEETFLVRAELECMAAKLTAAACTDSQIAELRKLIDFEQSIFNEQNIDKYYEANDNLHLKIADFSGNSILRIYIKELLEKARIYQILHDPFHKIEYSPTTEHLDIVNAIAQHDPEKACIAIRKHINSSITGLQTAGQKDKDYLTL